jgi:hypothetical protein
MESFEAGRCYDEDKEGMSLQSDLRKKGCRIIGRLPRPIHAMANLSAICVVGVEGIYV